MASDPSGQTALANLIQARDNVSTQIASITSNPKPSYSIDGQSVSWGEHLNNLMKAEEDLAKRINELSPYIITSVLM